MPLYILTPREPIPLFVGIARNSLRGMLEERFLRVTRTGSRAWSADTRDRLNGSEFVRLRAMGWQAGHPAVVDIPAINLLSIASLEAATPIFTVGMPPNQGGFHRNRRAILGEYRSFLESVHYTPDQITAELSRYRTMSEVVRFNYEQQATVVNPAGDGWMGDVCLVSRGQTWGEGKFTHVALLGARKFEGGRFVDGVIGY